MPDALPARATGQVNKPGESAPYTGQSSPNRSPNLPALEAVGSGIQQKDTSGSVGFIDNQLTNAALDPDAKPKPSEPEPSIFSQGWEWLMTKPTDNRDLNKFIWGLLAIFALGLLWKLGTRKTP